MIRDAWCLSFKLELWQGIHDFRVDTIKAALYTKDANLGPDTTVYTAEEEIAAVGYIPGGKACVVTPGYPKIENEQAVIRFEPIIWAPSSITARGVLFYNASKDNRAVLVRNFGVDRSSIANQFKIFVPLSAAPLGVIN